MDTDAILPPGFLSGANLPWLHYGIDFGRNAWRPEGGISQAREREQIETAFRKLAATGVEAVRWFLFCDGRAGIEFSAAGRPLTLDTNVIKDVETALAAAQRSNIRLMFVLLDFIWCDAARIVKGVQLGGRSAILQRPDLRDQLLEQIFQPLIRRFGREPAILAWDVINEPEWIGSVDEVEMDAFLRETIALIHSDSRHPVTVGSAGARWRERYRDLAVDFYQVHWYDKLWRQPDLGTPVGELGFNKPVILGEFPTRGSKRAPGEILRVVKDAGYAGAFYWSELAKDQCSATD